MEKNISDKPRIKLQKLGAAPDALFPTPSSEDFVVGGEQKDFFSGLLVRNSNAGKSLPVDYTLEGHLLAEPKVGESLRVFRTKRNDVEVLGETTTSEIKSLHLVEDDDPAVKYILNTQNSIYLLEYL